ncbi:MAG: HD domain-containing protein [Candidatus Staskawiczbacteria bacterium]|nr:HD domain-containing protein [Candidatus Staskawiczbacteria bacterium]
MTNKEIINEVILYLEQNFKNESTGHDYWHFIRVWKLAKYIAEKEGGDLFVIELGALLHDIADWKFHGGTNEVGIEKAKTLLKDFNVDEKIINQVCYIIDNISFKGAKVKNGMIGKEGEIVQDADKLDAIGAIGIARTFAYGGKMDREMYNPDIKPEMHTSFEGYKNSKGTSINHFYEKLLLLKDRLNTKTAKKIAQKRHKFTEDYLKEFFKEWEGKV